MITEIRLKSFIFSRFDRYNLLRERIRKRQQFQDEETWKAPWIET
jgi:hypothetical protein